MEYEGLVRAVRVVESEFEIRSVGHMSASCEKVSRQLLVMFQELTLVREELQSLGDRLARLEASCGIVSESESVSDSESTESENSSYVCPRLVD